MALQTPTFLQKAGFLYPMKQETEQAPWIKQGAYKEGESHAKLCSDIVLYAIWAHPPFIHAFELMEPIRYGQRLTIKIPDIEENNGRLTAAGIEISLDGSLGWEEISHNAILTVDYDGYYLRFYAENFVGRTYSNCVRITSYTMVRQRISPLPMTARLNQCCLEIFRRGYMQAITAMKKQRAELI